jgi:hypothetical protein
VKILWSKEVYLVEDWPICENSNLKTNYPFRNMNIGQSFFIDDFKKAQSARIAAYQFSKRTYLDWKFSLRKMDGGWRLFRIY